MDAATSSLICSQYFLDTGSFPVRPLYSLSISSSLASPNSVLGYTSSLTIIVGTSPQAPDGNCFHIKHHISSLVFFVFDIGSYKFIQTIVDFLTWQAVFRLSLDPHIYLSHQMKFSWKCGSLTRQLSFCHTDLLHPTLSNSSGISTFCPRYPAPIGISDYYRLFTYKK